MRIEPSTGRSTHGDEARGQKSRHTSLRAEDPRLPLTAISPNSVERRMLGAAFAEWRNVGRATLAGGYSTCHGCRSSF